MTRKDIFVIIEKDDGTNVWSHLYDVFMFCTIIISVVPLMFWDEYPATDLGRLISIFSSLFGVAIIALPSGIITANYLNELREIKEAGNAENAEPNNHNLEK